MTFEKVSMTICIFILGLMAGYAWAYTVFK
jgi:hypothetical protein